MDEFLKVRAMHPSQGATWFNGKHVPLFLMDQGLLPFASYIRVAVMKRQWCTDMNDHDEETINMVVYKRRCDSAIAAVEACLENDDPFLLERFATLRFIITKLLFVNGYLCERNPNSSGIRSILMLCNLWKSTPLQPSHQKRVELENDEGHYFTCAPCSCPLISQTLRPMIFPENIEAFFIQPSVCRSLWTSDTFQAYLPTDDDSLDVDSIFGITRDGLLLRSDGIGPAPYGALVDAVVDAPNGVTIHQLYTITDDDARLNLFYLYPLDPVEHGPNRWDWNFNLVIRDFLRQHGLLNHFHYLCFQRGQSG